MNPLDWIGDELAALNRANLLRQTATCRAPSATVVERDGRPLVNFASNDYLGLAADPRVQGAARKAAAEGWGSAASPLITGRREAHAELERELARFEDAESALLFSTGFAANVGAIASLVGSEDAVFSDAKNHASIIDGCRLSRANTFVYPHADVENLEQMLRRAGQFRRRLIVTDGLFSMDGDLAPLDAIANLAERYEAILMVDEAHATGVFGARGQGAGEYLGVHDRVHVRVATLSKALGSSGGFVTGSQALIDWLTNQARTYIFSTAMPAACCRAASAALAIIESEAERRETLLARAAELRARLIDQGWNVPPGIGQIVPVIVGDETAAVDLAADLREAGFCVPAIRSPSVARAEARLRISLSYAHSAAMIDGLIEALHRLVDRRPAGATQA